MDKVNEAVFDANAQSCDIMNHLIEEKIVKKINIAELLCNCPKGMELDCTMFENVTFIGVVDIEKQFPIEIKISGNKTKYLTKTGCFHDDILVPEAKCVIFPKGKTTWEGFQRPFKNGDILHINFTEEFDDEQYEYIFILDKIYNGEVHSYCHYYMRDGFHPKTAYLADDKYPIRFATEEEKEKLFNAIKENGYKWNIETKTLEKLTPNKFDITTLKPFDKVLARDTYKQTWIADFFSHNIKEPFGGYRFACVGHCWCQCIPYEGNEHLLGTTNDCDEYFKTWK